MCRRITAKQTLPQRLDLSHIQVRQFDYLRHDRGGHGELVGFGFHQDSSLSELLEPS